MVAQLKSLPSQTATYDPTKEYVAASGFFSAQMGAVLASIWSDEAEFLLGPGGYERLLTDPEIHKDITLLVEAILGDGVQLSPNFVDEKADPQKAELSAKYSAFCSLTLFETPQRPFRETLAECVKAALVTGHKVAEKTYRDYTDEEGRPKLVLDRLKCKPRDLTAFVDDPFLNVLGLRVWGFAGDAESFNQIIPRSKFFIPAFDIRDEDPRGSAPAMRAVYNWFQAKRAALPIALKRLEKKALPSIVGFTAPNEPELVDEVDTDGRPTGRKVTPQQVMAGVLSGLDNFSSAAFPNGASATALNLSGNGEEFISFMRMCNSEITAAILLQVLATNEGKYGTRAQARTHLEVLAMRIWHLKNIVADAVRNDILKEVLYLNEGPESLALVPAVTLGDTERRDWALDAQAAALIAPYVPDSVWAAICQQLGLPLPDESESWPTRTKSSSGRSQSDSSTNPNMTTAEGIALFQNMRSALKAAESILGGERRAA